MLFLYLIVDLDDIKFDNYDINNDENDNINLDNYECFMRIALKNEYEQCKVFQKR